MAKREEYSYSQGSVSLSFNFQLNEKNLENKKDFFALLDQARTDLGLEIEKQEKESQQIVAKPTEAPTIQENKKVVAKK